MSSTATNHQQGRDHQDGTQHHQTHDKKGDTHHGNEKDGENSHHSIKETTHDKAHSVAHPGEKVSSTATGKKDHDQGGKHHEVHDKKDDHHKGTEKKDGENSHHSIKETIQEKLHSVAHLGEKVISTVTGKKDHDKDQSNDNHAANQTDHHDTTAQADHIATTARRLSQESTHATSMAPAHLKSHANTHSEPNVV